MNIKEILSGIFYVGVNDRTTQKFEGLWHMCHGVSYNSYIVKDEKTALIDTVHTSSTSEYLNKIKSIISSETIDYLIINHMEPDHSGSILSMIQAYPNIKIVGNKLTIGMVKGYYHVADDERFIEVKDGDEISLGTKTLKFVLTPMVHWPETMMTYVVEDNVLFSGDAFGAFGALNGAVIDKDMSTDVYYDEIYRYYSNIVGKYGVFVQKALAKAQGLKIDYICSTHGPVWHDEIAKVVSIYDKLSRYEAEDGVVIVYGSMYGNTANVAETIAQNLAEKGVKNIRIHNASFSDLSDILADVFRYKGLIVGGPTYSMELFPPIESLMKALQTRELKNRVFATFGSFTWSSVVSKKLAAYAEAMKMPIVGSFEMKQAATEETYAKVKELAEVFVKELTAK